MVATDLSPEATDLIEVAITVLKPVLKKWDGVLVLRGRSLPLRVLQNLTEQGASPTC